MFYFFYTTKNETYEVDDSIQTTVWKNVAKVGMITSIRPRKWDFQVRGWETA